MKRIAITRGVSPSIDQCELTHLERLPIDYPEACRQHEEYESILEQLGCTVIRLPVAPDLPDAVFVEDTAIVLDEIAVIARPGAESRRPETESIARALAAFRPLSEIEPPTTLDGGDVLAAGRSIFVGVSSRTQEEGIAALARIVELHGYAVTAVDMRGCLHLKTAVTQVRDDALLLNPDFVEPDAFPGFETIHVDRHEPLAANALRIGSTVIVPRAFPATRESLERRGITTVTVPAEELAKAEGGVTCCSLVFTTA